MKRKLSTNLILTFLGIIYILSALFPLVKSLFSMKNNKTANNEEKWVELPLVTNK